MGDASQLLDNEKADGLRASIPEGFAERMSAMKKRFDDGDDLRAEDFKSLHDVVAEDDVQQWMASGEEDPPRLCRTDSPEFSANWSSQGGPKVP